MSDDELEMLDEVLMVENGLSDWEVEFIERLDKRRSRPLSDRERAKLIEISNDTV